MTDVVAATGNGVAVVREDERGRRATVAPLPGAQCLASAAGTLYVGCRGNGIWKSEDGAATWEELPLPERDVYSVAASPVDAAVYAGCEPSMLFRSDDGGTTWQELESLRSLPSAPTWSFPPRPWTSHVRWIAPSPHDPLRILVGIELGGLMVSEDGGATWHDHRPGAQRDVHSLAWHPSAEGRAYEAGGGGAAWSDDGGLTWRPADEGRDRHYTWAVAVDPGDPDRWYVSASPGPRAAHHPGRADALLYRWDGRGPWRALDEGLPQPLGAMPYALLALPGRLVAGLADGRLYASEDGGDTWRELTVGGDRLGAVVALAVL